MFMSIDRKVAVQASGKPSVATIRREVTIPMRGGLGTIFTFEGLDDGKEHIAIGFGNWREQASPLVRIHSECLTGDVFFSGKCDCGEQLNESIDRMQKVGGIVLYLRQEGRGIGLYNKMDAYELQGLGHDTYEANRLLGLADDLRDYTVAAQMLAAIGVESVQLLSNNPDKRQQLENLGIHVETSVNTGVFVKESNRRYLAAKVIKTGHSIRLEN
jgi:GTP cyclohydrolase II